MHIFTANSNIHLNWIKISLYSWKNICFMPRLILQRWDGGGKQYVGIWLDQIEERVCWAYQVGDDTHRTPGPRPAPAVSMASPTIESVSPLWFSIQGLWLIFRVRENQTNDNKGTSPSSTLTYFFSNFLSHRFNDFAWSVVISYRLLKPLLDSLVLHI